MRYRLVVKALVAGLIVLSAPATAAGAAEPPETPDASGTPITQNTPDVGESPEPPRSCPALGSQDFSAAEWGPVPGVMGATLENAVAELAQGGFRTTYKPADAAADWTVSDQSPNGGTRAVCGSAVTVYLREPVTDPTPTPEPDRVKVPDLSGLSAGAARRRLESRGLDLVMGSGDSGTVSAQDPAAGTFVEPGSAVTVELTPGTGPVDTGSPETTPTDGPGPVGETPDVGEGGATPIAGEGGEQPGIGPVDSVETGASSGPPSLVLLIVVAALAALGWLLRRARRGPGDAGDDPGGSGEGPRPAAPSVVCVPYADPSPQVEFRDVAPSFRLDFVCHHDQGRQEIREIVR